MTETTTGAATPALTHRQVLALLGGLALGMIVAMGSQSVVGPALPTIVGELGQQNDLPWIMTAQLLATCSSALLWGRLGDVYGRKRLFQLAICIFMVGSTLAGLSQSIPQLIGARVVQGLGGGGVMSLAMAIMASALGPRDRSRYMSYLATVMMVSGLAGPLLGGAIVDALSWRWCFFYVVPLGVVAVLVIQRVLRVPDERLDQRIDFTGAALVVGAVSSIVLLSSLGGRQLAWGSLGIKAFGLSAVVLGTLFVLQERRIAEPLLPLRLFADRDFSAAASGTFVNSLAQFSAMVFLPQYLQVTRGVSPVASGLMMVPLMAGNTGTSIVIGRLIGKTGRYKIFPVMGLSLVIVALALLSRLDGDTPFVQVALSMFVLGVGMGLTMLVLLLVAQNTLAPHELGIGTSCFQFSNSIGGALGVPIFGAIMNNRLAYHLPRLLAEVPGTAESGAGGPRTLLGSPAQIHALPPATRDAVIEAFARSLHLVFLCAIPAAVLGLALVLLIKEVPFREEVSPDGGVESLDDALEEADMVALLGAELTGAPVPLVVGDPQVSSATSSDVGAGTMGGGAAGEVDRSRMT